MLCVAWWELGTRCRYFKVKLDLLKQKEHKARLSWNTKRLTMTKKQNLAMTIKKKKDLNMNQ